MQSLKEAEISWQAAIGKQPKKWGTYLSSLPYNTTNTVLQAKDEEKGYFEYYVEK